VFEIPPTRLFDGLARPDLRVVVESASLRRYEAGQLIYDQASDAAEFYLLIRGRARYFFTTADGHRVLLRWLVPGDALGPRAILQTPAIYLMSAEALRESQLLVWHRSTIRDLLNRYPRLMDNALSLASEWAEWYVATHVAVVSATARARLAAVLAALVQIMGHQGPDGAEVRATNEELASAAYVTPFTVSRLLSDWNRAGILIKRRGIIVLVSPHRLSEAIS
jgi:CRP-like cAMP-binding protein